MHSTEELLAALRGSGARGSVSTNNQTKTIHLSISTQGGKLDLTSDDADELMAKLTEILRSQVFGRD